MAQRPARQRKPLRLERAKSGPQAQSAIRENECGGGGEGDQQGKHHEAHRTIFLRGAAVHRENSADWADNCESSEMFRRWEYVLYLFSPVKRKRCKRNHRCGESKLDFHTNSR
jgi:hypothetical protein